MSEVALVEHRADPPRVPDAAWTGEPSGNLLRRHLRAAIFHRLCQGATFVGVAFLAVLLVQVVIEGWSFLDLDLLTSLPSRKADKMGIKASVVGTLWVISFTALFSVPIGIAAAVYLEEYARKGRLSTIIQVNISNLAGVPSIVYGILGLVVFVRALQMGHSILAGAFTLSLLILPVIIIASREAIRAVPSSVRLAAFALGATRWQTVRSHVLPAALPGILTGVILAVSRAIGEAAPLIILGVPIYHSMIPSAPTDDFTVLPLQIYEMAKRPQAEFHQVAAAAIVVLLTVLLLMNATAILIRHRWERRVI